MRQNLIGKRFGKLVIRKMLPDRKCVCDCDCGVVSVKRYDHVEAGNTASCGCSRGEFVSRNRARHGDSRRSGRAPEFTVWVKMKARCCNDGDPSYRYYGGRGISVCDKWLSSYESFIADMGRRPSPDHQLDRINNAGNYEPGNVRWATRKQQCRNRRTSRLVTALGETRTLAGWGERTGIDQMTIRARLERGWNPDDAVSREVLTHA